MKVKNIIEMVEGVCLIAIDKQIKYGNSYTSMPEPPEEIMNQTVQSIVPFTSQGVFKYGIIVHVKEGKTK